MGTKERVEILNNKDTAINELLKRISELEFEVERQDKEIKELKDGWQEEVYSKNEVLNDWFECERKINILHYIIRKLEEHLLEVIKDNKDKTDDNSITMVAQTNYIYNYIQELKGDKE